MTNPQHLMHLDAQIVCRTGTDHGTPVARDSVPAAMSIGGAAKRGRPPGRGRSKRSPRALAVLCERFVTFVKAHPGLRIAEISEELGTRTRDLVLPVRKLVAVGAIHIEGRGRATAYFAMNVTVRSTASRIDAGASPVGLDGTRASMDGKTFI